MCNTTSVNCTDPGIKYNNGIQIHDFKTTSNENKPTLTITFYQFVLTEQIVTETMVNEETIVIIVITNCEYCKILYKIYYS